MKTLERRHKAMGTQTRLFRFGDTVRVMQTTDMERAGLANQIGTVMEHQRTPAHLVTVALDDDGTNPNHVEIPADSLIGK